MSNLKYRLLTIVALCAVSVWALFPRDVTVKVRGSDGILRDTVVERVPLRKGLDLQGGTYLVLEVDDSKQPLTAEAKTDAIARALTTVRTRVEGIGVSETIVQQSGNDRIVVQIPGLQEPERARALVEEQAFLEFKITDRSGALERSLARIDRAIREKGVATAAPTTAPITPTDAPQPRTLDNLLQRADTGRATASGDSAVAGDSAAAADSTQPVTGGPLSSIVQAGNSTVTGEYMVEGKNWTTMRSYIEMPEVQAALPPGKQLLVSRDSLVQGSSVYRYIYVVDRRPIITGEYLEDARPNQSPTDGVIVQFEMNNTGGRRFRNETGKNIGNHMAIVLDGIVMGRPPVIQGAIGTQGQITMGGQDLVAAQDLALVLRAGALPVPLRVAEVRNIGPSLGQDSIDQGIKAGLLGLLFVVIIMVGYYRFSGILAIGGLMFYALTTLAFLALFGATLTLPGIAGFILSIGMAVDANFLQFERIREELARGKTVRTAIDEGFRNSLAAIIDTHVTTALTGAVLYQYGTGPVKGFAVTLVAGVVSSILSSVFVVRTLFLLWLSRSRSAQTLSI